MSDYKNFGNKYINVSNIDEVVEAYDQGFVMTRKESGYSEKVRSLRINLRKFNLSSENRRILRKYNHDVKVNTIPFNNYSWEIHKLGKDFYDSKFGKDTFSANKIKELFTSTNTNFNKILTFTNQENNKIDGYCIVLVTDNDSNKIIHYAYPFYNLDLINSNFGMYMMTKSIQYFKENGFNYIYLGSVHEPSSLYKLQFEGAEWWDEEVSDWSNDLLRLKNRVHKVLVM